eukprot:SAG31_NODE_3801_length_3870_cov_1.727658_1_plen_199_part_00
MITVCLLPSLFHKFVLILLLAFYAGLLYTAFDRTDPDNPVFIGVAGMDLLVSSMQTGVLPEGPADQARQLALQALASRAQANCPASLSQGSETQHECMIQALRRSSGNSNAMCPNQCTATSEAVAMRACLSPSEYPQEDLRRDHGSGVHQRQVPVEHDIWHNNFDEIRYLERDSQRIQIDNWQFNYHTVACCSIGQVL